MDSIKQIDVHKVKIIEDNDSATIVDIRDPASYQAGHIPNAIHLSDNTVEKFISDTDKNKPLVVYCYHGISSQGAAAYFSEQGFKEVSSMIGGFEAWRIAFSDSVAKKE
jgi:thiosulfate sulfurtransferase